MHIGESAGSIVFDVAIVSYNTDAYLHNLLVSLRDHLPARRVGAVHVWDNGSSDATSAMLSLFGSLAPWLHVHRSPTNIHHGPALDLLMRRHCAAEWVLLLDSDTEVRCDFTTSLRLSRGTPPAFVGQIHPQMTHLYAYLAHVLVHRPTYLTLPSFRHDGAPGDEFFRAVEARRLSYQRFRWCDYVGHAGQASLRGVHARGETTHPFYAFAAAAARTAPVSSDRAAHEEQLRSRLAEFLERVPHRSSVTTPRRSEPGTFRSRVGPGPEGPGLHLSRRSWLAGVRTSCRACIDAVRDPHAARALHRATHIGLVQQVPEIRELFRRVRRMRPRRVLEIGTAYGGSLYLWTRASAADARVISVDMPPWELDDPAEAGKRVQLRSFARARQSIELIRGNSHDAASLDAVRAALGGEPLDFLFVDGDDSADGVRRDIADYGTLLRPGGLMVASQRIAAQREGAGCRS